MQSLASGILQMEPDVVQRSKIMKTRRRTEVNPVTGEKIVRTWKVPVYVVRVKMPDGRYKQVASLPTDDEEVERPADQSRRIANDYFNMEQEAVAAEGGVKRRRRHIGTIHTVYDASEAYIRSRERKGLRKGTVKDYRAFLDHHVLPWFARRRLDNVRMVTARHIAELRDDLLDDNGFEKRDTLGKPIGPPQPLLPQAKREIFRLAKAILNEAVQQTWIKEVPGGNLEIEFPSSEAARQKQVAKDKAFRPDEVRLLLVTADRLAQDPNPSTRRAWAHSYRGLLYLAAYTGLRVSELLALTFDRLDLDSGIMSVAGAIDRYMKHGGGKTEHAVRDVRLDPDVIQVLREMFAARAQEIRHDDALVWASRTGKPLSYSNIHDRSWQPLIERSTEVAKELGMRPLREVDRRAYHGFRHFVTSVLRQQEIPIANIGAVVGHGSRRINDHYNNPAIFGPETPRNLPQSARAPQKRRE